MLVAYPTFDSGRRMRSGTGMWLLLCLVVAIAGVVGALVMWAGTLGG
jgi:hypothetical protein